MTVRPNGSPTTSSVSVVAAALKQSAKFSTVKIMKSFSFFVIYAVSLAPIAALTLYISDTAALQITSSFELVIDMLETLNRALI